MGVPDEPDVEGIADDLLVRWAPDDRRCGRLEHRDVRPRGSIVHGHFTTKFLRAVISRGKSAGGSATAGARVLIGGARPTDAAGHRVTHRQLVSVRPGTGRSLETRTLVPATSVQQSSAVATAGASQDLCQPVLRSPERASSA